MWGLTSRTWQVQGPIGCWSAACAAAAVAPCTPPPPPPSLPHPHRGVEDLLKADSHMVALSEGFMVDLSAVAGALSIGALPRRVRWQPRCRLRAAAAAAARPPTLTLPARPPVPAPPPPDYDTITEVYGGIKVRPPDPNGAGRCGRRLPWRAAPLLAPTVTLRPHACPPPRRAPLPLCCSRPAPSCRAACRRRPSLRLCTQRWVEDGGGWVGERVVGG